MPISIKSNPTCATCYDTSTPNNPVDIYKVEKKLTDGSDNKCYFYAYHQECGSEHKNKATLGVDYVFEKSKNLSS